MLMAMVQRTDALQKKLMEQSLHCFPIPKGTAS
jgi:hypothetical protein